MRIAVCLTVARLSLENEKTQKNQIYTNDAHVMSLNEQFSRSQHCIISRQEICNNYRTEGRTNLQPGRSITYTQVHRALQAFNFRSQKVKGQETGANDGKCAITDEQAVIVFELSRKCWTVHLKLTSLGAHAAKRSKVEGRALITGKMHKMLLICSQNRVPRPGSKIHYTLFQIRAMSTLFRHDPIKCNQFLACICIHSSNGQFVKEWPCCCVEGSYPGVIHLF